MGRDGGRETAKGVMGAGGRDGRGGRGGRAGVVGRGRAWWGRGAAGRGALPTLHPYRRLVPFPQSRASEAGATGSIPSQGPETPPVMWGGQN